jgi:poly(3-hydroxybutyrate) depolymerase
MSLLSTKIDAKTGSTSVSAHNQLSKHLSKIDSWCIVGWGHCKGQKTPSTASIMVKIDVHFSDSN